MLSSRVSRHSNRPTARQQAALAICTVRQCLVRTLLRLCGSWLTLGLRPVTEFAQTRGIAAHSAPMCRCAGKITTEPQSTRVAGTCLPDGVIGCRRFTPDLAVRGWRVTHRPHQRHRATDRRCWPAGTESFTRSRPSSRFRHPNESCSQPHGSRRARTMPMICLLNDRGHAGTRHSRITRKASIAW